jgi:hypothetical protein
MGNAVRHGSMALCKPRISVSTGSPTDLDTNHRSFIREARQKALQDHTSLVQGQSRMYQKRTKAQGNLPLKLLSSRWSSSMDDYKINWDKSAGVSNIWNAEVHSQFYIKFCHKGAKIAQYANWATDSEHRGIGVRFWRATVIYLFSIVSAYRPWGTPSLLYNGYLGLFPSGVERTGREATCPLPHVVTLWY